MKQSFAFSSKRPDTQHSLVSSAAYMKAKWLCGLQKQRFSSCLAAYACRFENKASAVAKTRVAIRSDLNMVTKRIDRDNKGGPASAFIVSKDSC